MKIWFTSDLHLGHTNIMKYCNRPFKTIEQMNETIIRNWNAKIHKHDIVFHLGDFCFKNTKGGKDGEGLILSADKYLERLNGHITFIEGNHDGNNSLKAVIKYAIIELGGQKIFLVHNPKEANMKYPLNIVGHIHNLWKVKEINKRYIVNVGVDVWNFHPVDINEVQKAISDFIKRGK
jgi:calcineurin-like phosphoesterase family protein